MAKGLSLPHCQSFFLGTSIYVWLLIFLGSPNPIFYLWFSFLSHSTSIIYWNSRKLEFVINQDGWHYSPSTIQMQTSPSPTWALHFTCFMISNNLAFPLSEISHTTPSVLRHQFSLTPDPPPYSQQVERPEKSSPGTDSFYWDYNPALPKCTHSSLPNTTFILTPYFQWSC